MQTVERTDRLGNVLAAGLPYAHGRILTGTETDIIKLQRAWEIIAERGIDRVFNFTGLEHGLPMKAAEVAYVTDEIAPAMCAERLRGAALSHLGGVNPTHEVAVFNRLTGATICTAMALVKPGDVVIGVSASHSHPSVARAVALAGGSFVDVVGAEQFEDALARHPTVSVAVITRLAVTYELLDIDDIYRIVAASRARGILVYADDAGGARVGPAIFGQPNLIDVGADIVATGLDKYGTIGPRLGLLVGKKNLVEKIRARSWELAMEARPMLFPAVVNTLEAYKPERVRELVTCTKRLATVLRAHLGDLVCETPVIATLRGDDILGLAMRRAGLSAPPIVPFEATAALCMLLLQDYGILTVHFVGLPPGTGDLLIKFVPPETLSAFGGAEAFATALDRSISRLAELLKKGDMLRSLYFGSRLEGQKNPFAARVK